ncbi:MAG: antibiotic biosynthesis monooxygenase [Clostridia bacterium]|jgi:autoinducer 2-degrading protein|nr:antibiotic biosynthesis monooxygenase [Oscillospiraceae bacterium]MBR6748277.1 antibiotic biosynthesis monooxygenase [Clostridia bacterium]
MKIVIVYLEAKPEKAEEFAEISRLNHEGSVKEEGCIRFDVLRNKEEPNKFVLYEVWESEEALARHKTTQHFLNWDAANATCLVRPRYRDSYDAVGFTTK